MINLRGVRLADEDSRPLFGKYRGVVSEVDAKTMRIKATIPVLLLKEEVWCDPCVPYAGPGIGFCFLPEPKSGVWIEFENGDPSLPIWTGAFWYIDEVPAGLTAQVKTIITVVGHVIELDDDAGSVTITDSNENKIVMDSGGISLECGGKKIKLTQTKVDINDGALEVA